MKILVSKELQKLSPQDFSISKKGCRPVIVDGVPCILKFAERQSPFEGREYLFSHFAEFVSSQFFSLCGIETQRTELVQVKKQNEINCACKCDLFTSEKIQFINFAKIKESLSMEDCKTFDTELSEILYAIENQAFIPAEEFKNHFYTIFVIDTICGNTDRNNKNWGLLFNTQKKEYSIAPIFDNARSLMCYKTPEKMQSLLGNTQEFKKLIFNKTYLCIKENHLNISAHKFLKQTNDKNLLAVKDKILSKIKDEYIIEEISKVIQSQELIPEIARDFFCEYLKISTELQSAGTQT